MSKQPITISYDELNTRKVEQRVREQQAIARNRTYSQLDYASVPMTTPGLDLKARLLHSTVFWLTCMGLLGGLLAWGLGATVQLKPREQQAAELLRGFIRIGNQQNAGIISPAQANASLELLRRQGKSNPYFVAATDANATPLQRMAAMRQIERQSKLKRFLANILSFGISGLVLALCLAVAEPLSERNYPAAARNGAIGAIVGLAGGLLVALFVDRLYRSVAGDASGSDADSGRAMLARVIAWGVLGLFLTIGSGLVLRNVKKLSIGLLGGLVGGSIGGLLFDPVEQWAGPQASRLIALVAIGVVAGFATAWIENAAKTGWLKVTAGLIAGKQFILYRNPTYIGSAPDCQIYLFRDPQVGKRHAALHLLPNGVELEDLPLGAPTLVNGNAVTRVRLHAGDRIDVGSTSFLFQEKPKT